MVQKVFTFSVECGNIAGSAPCVDGYVDRIAADGWHIISVSTTLVPVDGLRGNLSSHCVLYSLLAERD